MSIEKAKSVLGWQLRYSNKDALIRNYRWYLENKHAFAGASGVSHRVSWKQGILGFVKLFFMETVSVKGFCAFLRNNIPLVIAVTTVLFFTYGIKLFWYSVWIDTELFMADKSASFREMAGLLGLSGSAYYRWAKYGCATWRRETDDELLRLIRELVVRHHRRYGSPQVRAKLCLWYGTWFRGSLP